MATKPFQILIGISKTFKWVICDRESLIEFQILIGISKTQ